MKRLRFFILLIFFNPLKSFCQQLFILNSNGAQCSYSVLFSDEFNGPQLDANKWQNAFPWGRHLTGNTPQEESLEYYTDGKNISITDGVLSLTARRERTCGICESWVDSVHLNKNGERNYRCFDYSSGMIYSKEAFGYGLYEIKFKQAANSKGLWPAFWLYGNSNEIDIFENKGERSAETHWDLHCKDGCRKKNGGWAKVKTDFTNGFNTIAIDWTPDKQRWYCNGVNYATAFQPYSGKMNIIANNAVSRNRKEKGFWVGTDESTVFPSALAIDYIRYYNRNYNERTYNGKLSNTEIVKGLRESDANIYRQSNAKKRNNQLLAIYIDMVSHTANVNCFSSKENAEIFIYDMSGNLKKNKIVKGNDQVTIEGLPDEDLVIITRVGKKLLAESVKARR